MRQARLPRDLAVDPPAARRARRPRRPRGRRGAAGERLGVALAPIVAALDLSEVVLAGPEELLAPVLPVLERTLAQRLLADPDAPLSVRLAAITRGHRPARRRRRGPLGPARGRLDPATTPQPGPDAPHLPTHTQHHQHRTTTTRTSVHTTGPTGPTARKEDRMIRRLPIVALTSAALVLTACASGGDSSDTPAATSSTSNAGKTITLWLAGGDTPDELRTYLQRHLQGQDRGHPQDRGAGLGRPRHQADHRPARRREHPRRRRARQHPEPDLHQRRCLPRHLRPVRRARRRQAAAVLRRGRLGRRQEVRPALLLRLALHVHAQGRLEGGRRRHADHPRRVQRRRDQDRRRRTRATSRTSPASSSAARTGATASPGSSPTAATWPRRRTASGSRPSPTRTRSRA